MCKQGPVLPQAVAVPCGAVMGTINGEPFLCNATAGHDGNHSFTQSWQAVATPDLVEQAKIYFQREYDRDRTQSIFVGMAKFAAMHAASLEARVRTLEQELAIYKPSAKIDIGGTV